MHNKRGFIECTSGDEIHSLIIQGNKVSYRGKHIACATKCREKTLLTFSDKTDLLIDNKKDNREMTDKPLTQDECVEIADMLDEYGYITEWKHYEERKEQIFKEFPYLRITLYNSDVAKNMQAVAVEHIHNSGI